MWVALFLLVLVAAAAGHNGVDHGTQDNPVRLQAPGFRLERLGHVRDAVYADSPPGSTDVLVGNTRGEIWRLGGERLLSLGTGERGDGIVYSFAFRGGRLYASIYLDRTNTLTVTEYVLLRHRLRPRRQLAAVRYVDRTEHTGSQLAFGPDGYLYVSTGDGGRLGVPGDPFGFAQDWRRRQGKLLRIDARTGRVRTWAVGLRNPFRFTVHGGSLLVADVGHDRREEVSRVSLRARRPNFGWPAYEGSLNYQAGTLQGTVIQPLFEQRHRGDFCAITGGVVSRGRYLYGDYCTGSIWQAVLDRGAGRPTGLLVPELVAFAMTRRGVLVVSSRHGIYRLLRAARG